MSGDLGEAVAPPMEQLEGDGPSQMDILIDALIVLDIEYTLVQDEAGVTLDIEGGNRGTAAFSGVSVTFNFGPDESFLFMGLAR